jgi:DNA-nicking Smr family endonuclease
LFNLLSVSARAKNPGRKAGRHRQPEVAAQAAVSRPFAKVVPRLKKALAEAKASSTRVESTSTKATVVTEELAFAEHMRNVTPLPAKSGRITKRTEPVTMEAPSDDGVLTGGEPQPWRFEVQDDGVLLEGRRVDVDPRELRRLRTKRYPVDGKLDLHGMTVACARRTTLEFVAKRRSQGDRVVEIVHGKGSHSPRGEAVLRGELGAWLSQGIAVKAVLAFVSVVERGDESGAVLVLLAKR